MKEFEDFQEVFQRIRRRVLDDPRFREDFVCKAGLWPDAEEPGAVVLKLLKRHWSNDVAETMVSTSGIFFSIWIDREALRKGRLRYNLHALKLRRLDGYSLESRKFATAFRRAFSPMLQAWPNVKMEFGPQTLFEGYVAIPAAEMEPAIWKLVEAFLPLGKVIDCLLAEIRPPGLSP
jgi:hypothetical protein